MNDCILLALGLTPHEMLWGQREMLREKPMTEWEREVTENYAMHHSASADMLCSQGYTGAITEGVCRKACFNDKVHLTEFSKGDRVQVYNSRLEVTYEAKAKLLPHWSLPHIITDRLLNSYMLCWLDGMELRGTTHA